VIVERAAQAAADTVREILGFDVEYRIVSIEAPPEEGWFWGSTVVGPFRMVYRKAAL
jgi:hypothetical protein